MDIINFFSFFITLLIICNPMSALPVFLMVTQNHTIEQKKQTAIKASIAVAVILVGMTFVGNYMLQALSIKVYAFQVMAGLVLIMLAFTMLNAETSRLKKTREEEKEAMQKESVAIVPLAIPLIAGPGAISTIIIRLGDIPNLQHQLIVSGICIVIAFIIGIIWYYAGALERKVGHTGINIITRIGGLILGAISLQTFAEGLIGFFPVLASR
ncbi:MAG: NAAT family transporter [Simkaniaceae bacterium]|nr:NAAT family transporter [Simkaniaceae bacterium]MCF7852358.1 NAAT family transporter [Simkaniaceae bacterium]